MKTLNTDTQEGTPPLLALKCAKAMKWTKGSKLSDLDLFPKTHTKPYFNILKEWPSSIPLNYWNKVLTRFFFFCGNKSQTDNLEPFVHFIASFYFSCILA